MVLWDKISWYFFGYNLSVIHMLLLCNNGAIVVAWFYRIGAIRMKSKGAGRIIKAEKLISYSFFEDRNNVTDEMVI